MATLDVRRADLPGIANAQVNYSSLYPLTLEMSRKLGESITLARRVLDQVMMTLSNFEYLQNPYLGMRPDFGPTLISRTGQFSVPVRNAFQRHFHIDAAQPKNTWEKYFNLIKGKYASIKQGLNANLVIADARAKAIKHRLRGLDPDLFGFRPEGMTNQEIVEAMHASTEERPGRFAITPWQKRAHQAKLDDRAAEIQSIKTDVENKDYQLDDEKKVARGYVTSKTAHLSSKDRDDFSNKALRGKHLKVEIGPEHRKSIHFDFHYLTTAGVASKYSHLSVARTIIHEASHRFASTKDFAYIFNAPYGTLGKNKAVNNADSYAWMAISIYKNFNFNSPAVMNGCGGHGINVDA
jgi:hypothetical protein